MLRELLQNVTQYIVSFHESKAISQSMAKQHVYIKAFIDSSEKQLYV